MTAPQTMRGLAFAPRSDSLVELRDDLALPHPKPSEIRVRVTHATVNGHEFDLARNPLMRAIGFVRGARGPVRTGLEFAGIVDSGVSGASLGEVAGARGIEVMGYVELTAGRRPHAEYVTIPEAYVGRVPAGLSLAEASTLPMSGLTALAALRDVARVEPGQRVLILGASGGVGVLAIQIANILGATSTAVASKAHHVRLRELGATEVVDRGRVADLSGPFDAILDFSATQRLRTVKHLLTPNGVFVPADPVKNAIDVLFSSRTAYLMVDRGNTERLAELAHWVEDGRLTPVIDQTFSLDQWRSAVTRSRQRGRLGRTVLGFGPTHPKSR